MLYGAFESKFSFDDIFLGLVGIDGLIVLGSLAGIEELPITLEVVLGRVQVLMHHNSTILLVAWTHRRSA